MDAGALAAGADVKVSVVLRHRLRERTGAPPVLAARDRPALLVATTGQGGLAGTGRCWGRRQDSPLGQAGGRRATATGIQGLDKLVATLIQGAHAGDYVLRVAVDRPPTGTSR